MAQNIQTAIELLQAIARKGDEIAPNWGTHYDPRQATIDLDDMPMVPECGCKIPRVQDPVDACRKASIMLERMMAFYGVQPNSIGRNENAGIAAGFWGGSGFIGGLLRTDQATFDDAAVAGTVQTASFSGVNLAKLYGCRINWVWCTVSSASQTGGQLISQSMDCEVTMRVNGYTVGQFQGVILGQIATQPNGDRQAIDLRGQNIVIPPGSQVEYDLRLLDTLNGTAGQLSGVRIMVDAGDGVRPQIMRG